jgi:hypothetical protein
MKPEIRHADYVERMSNTRRLGFTLRCSGMLLVSP